MFGLNEEPAKGCDSPWLTWLCLNRFRSGYTCSKEQRKKWGILHWRHHMCKRDGRRKHSSHATMCCCCLHTPPCLLGGVLPYFEVTGHPVPVSSLGLKCPDCFIWNCSHIVYPLRMKCPFRYNCLRYY